MSESKVLMFPQKLNKKQPLEKQKGSWNQGDLVEGREGHIHRSGFSDAGHSMLKLNGPGHQDY